MATQRDGVYRAWGVTAVGGVSHLFELRPAPGHDLMDGGPLCGVSVPVQPGTRYRQVDLSPGREQRCSACLLAYSRVRRAARAARAATDESAATQAGTDTVTAECLLIGGLLALTRAAGDLPALRHAMDLVIDTDLDSAHFRVREMAVLYDALSDYALTPGDTGCVCGRCLLRLLSDVPAPSPDAGAYRLRACQLAWSLHREHGDAELARLADAIVAAAVTGEGGAG